MVACGRKLTANGVSHHPQSRFIVQRLLVVLDVVVVSVVAQSRFIVQRLVSLRPRLWLTV